MKNQLRTIPMFTFVFLCCISRNLQAQLTATSSTNYAMLVDSFTLSGVSISNIKYTGNALSCGFFSNGHTTNLGSRSGIILSTGYAADIGNGVSSTGNGDMGKSGDSLIESITGGTTYDAAVLEFDLVPANDTLSFRFIYGSEDYPEWVGGNSLYQDHIGAFISGSNPSGGNYSNKNFALVPNTNLPIVVNNINDTFNSQYFVKNTSGSVIFDGFTKVLEAKIPVVPSASYHLTFGIADGGDKASDAGFFLQSHSLVSYSNNAGLSETRKQGVFLLYPNPAKDKIICSTKDIGILTITNQLGQNMDALAISKGQTQIATDNFQSGIYFFTFQTGNQVVTRKLIVQK